MHPIASAAEAGLHETIWAGWVVKPIHYTVEFSDPMKIQVKLFGPESQAIGASAVTLELPSDTARPAEVLHAIEKKFPELAAQLRACRVAVNHEFAAEDSVIGESDEVALVGQVSGG
jgi:molybdopterin converting factor small subunit